MATDAKTQRGQSGGASPDGLPPLRDVIETHGLSARKSLGQNFILDLNLTRRIARTCGDLAGRTVIEIGPGPGGLTRGLLLEGAGRIITVERDSRCLPALAEIADAHPGRLSVHDGDALDTDWPALLAQHGSDPPDSAARAIIAANLPYAIATKLLIGWLETEPWPPWFDRMLLMFQQEVAERIVATPGSKAYGRLSVIAQWRCATRIVLKLGPEAFTPPPKVASAVVELVPRDTLHPACSVKTLGRVTAAALGQRRKMLRVALKQLTPLPELLLERVQIDPTLRAEELSVSDFARLAAAFDGQTPS